MDEVIRQTDKFREIRTYGDHSTWFLSSFVTVKSHF